jgi:hypothetical protein
LPTIIVSEPFDLHASNRPCGFNPYQELPMNLSDVVLECATECARLSRESRDKQIGFALFEISARLFSAATCDAELLVEDAHAAAQPVAGAGLRTKV